MRRLRRAICWVLIACSVLCSGSVVFADTEESSGVVGTEASSAGSVAGMTALAEYALSWDGHTEIPYVFGGDGRGMRSLEEVSAKGAGLDCSGFVCLVYKHFNINIPMQSGDIKNAAVRQFTSESEAVPGDVCWWDGHVAIYIGDGKIVHTNTKYPPTNYPHVSSFDDYRYPTMYLRMVEDISLLQPLSGSAGNEASSAVINATSYGSIITESDITGMIDESTIKLEQQRIDLMGREGLSVSELASLEIIDEYYRSQRNPLRWFQYFQSFLGICCIVYGLLLGVAYLLDYVNVFVDFSLLAVLSLGRFRILDRDDLDYASRVGRRGVVYLTPGMLIVRIVFLFAIGCTLISGVIGDFLVWLIWKLGF